MKRKKLVRKVQTHLDLSRLSRRNFQVLNEEHKFHNLYFASIFPEAMVIEMSRIFKYGVDNIFFEIKGDYLRYCVDVKSFEQTARKLAGLVKRDPSYAEAVNAKLFELIRQANSFSRFLLSTDFSKKSNGELISITKKYRDLCKEMITYGMFSAVMEFHEPLYSDFLTQIVLQKLEKRRLGFSVGEVVALLTSFDGETLSKLEQIALLKLAVRIGDAKNISKYSIDLRKHAEEFGWLAYNYGGPAWTEKEYFESLAALLKLPGNHVEKLEEIKKHDVELAEKRSYFERELVLSEVEKKYFSIGRDFVKGKALRKEAMSLACFASEPLHREIAKRLNLSFLQVRFMLQGELEAALNGGKINEDELTQRTKLVVFGVFEGGKYRVVSSGIEAQNYAQVIREDAVDSSLQVLVGACASGGKATGVVKILNHPSEIPKMNKGDILVSIATTSDLVPAMRLASAIVTDLGGLTSHAAIVSRELHIPCVIGARIATKWLKDGDVIEVDASKGTVKKIV